jgi:hypothetical protein
LDWYTREIHTLIAISHQHDGNEQQFIAFFVCSFATAIPHPMQERTPSKKEKPARKTMPSQITATVPHPKHSGPSFIQPCLCQRLEDLEMVRSGNES